MSEIAIRVENLGKMYRIGAMQRKGGQRTYKALRDAIADAAGTPFRALRSRLSGAGRPPVESDKIFWALSDVSFEVKRGEVVGLIGRNGAGKSTLLKILSRITEPTNGSASIHGRVGSLLEVGTGFHPELTGRDNIYLNGALLGMKRSQIMSKFDEIVSFSEVEKFIDTPVKHYSSGMYLRLAFAVAANLEPDTLLVDEVLAVGDARFQAKCLGRMGAIADTGRTVVLVSHQMNAIRKLCTRCVWIEGGSVRADGPASDVVGQYEAAQRAASGDPGAARVGEGGRFLDWRIATDRDDERHTVDSLDPVEFSFRASLGRDVRNAVFGVTLYDTQRNVIWGHALYDLTLEAGNHDFVVRVPYLPVRPGAYFWQVSLWADGINLDLWDCLPPMMVTTPPLGHPRDEWSGALNIPSDLTVVPSLERV